MSLLIIMVSLIVRLKTEYKTWVGTSVNVYRQTEVQFHPIGIAGYTLTSTYYIILLFVKNIIYMSYKQLTFVLRRHFL